MRPDHFSRGSAISHSPQVIVRYPGSLTQVLDASLMHVKALVSTKDKVSNDGRCPQLTNLFLGG